MGDDQQSASLRAEGDRAIAMVPVNVAQEQVKVSDAQVTVSIRELEGKAKFERIALDLQVELARIEAEKLARIAAAEAAGKALAAAEMTIYGDPQTAQRMLASIVQGQSLGLFADGLNQTLPPGLKDAASAGGAALGVGIAALIKKFTGIDVDPANAESIVRGGVKRAETNGDATQA